MAKNQGRTQRDARPRIGSAHEAGGIVAHNIKPRDRLAGGIERAGVGVRAHADEGSYVTWYKANGIEWPPINRGDTGVRTMPDTAIEALIGISALTELGILAQGGTLV